MKRTFSLILKAVVVLFAAAGVFFSVRAGSHSFMGGRSVLMYFTIQSNIAVACISLLGIWLLLRSRAVPDWWYVAKFMGAISITLTGAVFAFVLAPTMGRLAWTRNNVFTHAVVPIAFVLDFFLTGTESELPRRSVWLTLLPPLAYVIYAGVGYVCRWEFAPGVNYPYFFLNWGSPAGAFGFSRELPFMGCMWWILMLLVLLILVGLAYLAILRGLKRLTHGKTGVRSGR